MSYSCSECKHWPPLGCTQRARRDTTNTRRMRQLPRLAGKEHWIAAIITASLITCSAARSSSRSGKGSKENVANPALVFSWLGVGLGCVGSILIWCFILECNPAPSQTRSWMHTFLAIIFAVELGFAWTFSFQRWLYPAALLLMVWGPLDAVLRFPVVHDVCSWFTLKQVAIIVARVIVLIFGAPPDLGHSMAPIRLYMFLVLLLTILTLPICYCLSLPLDEAPSFRDQVSHDVVDVDIAVRIWRVAADPQERAAWISQCRRRLRAWAVELGTRSPTASAALQYLDPSFKRLLNSGRKV